MKYRNLLFLGLVGWLTSCSSRHCKIDGTVENGQKGDTVFFTKLAGGTFVPMDTVVLDTPDFSIQKECGDSTLIASFYYLDKQNNAMHSNFFFIERGTVNLQIGSNGKVSGTENNDIYQQISDSVYAVYDKMSDIYSQQKSSSDLTGVELDAQTEQKLVALDREVNLLVSDNIKTFINKPVGYFLFLSCYNMFKPEEILELSDEIPTQYKNDHTLSYIRESAEQSLSAASEGQSFMDLTLPSMDGGELRLLDVVKANKLTLIDCWASWCGPCRSEMPELVALYAAYHNKGLEIIGVSFDEDEEAWKSAVESMKMTWPQVSELKSWDNVMTRQYGISSIPHTILVDQNGTILAQKLRGEELENTIKTLLDK